MGIHNFQLIEISLLVINSASVLSQFPGVPVRFVKEFVVTKVKGGITAYVFT